jgi:hypothetical protein
MFIGMMVISMSFAGTLKNAYPLVSIYTGAGILFILGAIALIPIMSQKAPESSQDVQPVAADLGTH